MAHSLRKYLSNRGSALFMVLSTMTALMVTCMAMYFAVLSSASAQISVFNQQQSYQSAISISEMAVGSLNDLLSNTGVSIESVPVGETILTTDGNGFKSLNPSASSDDDNYLGAYDVTMTRLADEKMDGKTFLTVDIAVTTSVSGVKEVYHQVVNVIQEGGSPNQKGKIFASTGYVPNDSFISKGSFYSDMYISNEDVVAGAFSGTELHFYSNIYCENSFTLLDGVNIKNNAPGPIVHAVRRDYNIGTGDGIGIKGNSYILVGGDMHLARGFNTSGGSDILEVYIGGDLYIEDGAQNLNSSKLRFYVAGNVFINSGNSSCIPGVIYCNKVYYLAGKEKNSYNPGSVLEENKNDDWWENDQDKAHGIMSMSFQEAMEMLESKTPNVQYKLWKIDESKLGSSIGKTNDKGEITGGKEVDLVFKSINGQSMYEPIVYTHGKDGNGFILNNIKIDGGGNNSVNNVPTLIIDTGDDPSNTFVIRLKNNNKSKKGTEYFSWSPKNPDGSQTNAPMQVFVKGNGSLVIDVPEGVVYQESNNVRIAHYNWYILTNGSGIAEQAGKKYYTTQQDAFLGMNLKDYVHSSCEDGDGCHYDIEKTSDKCEYCGSEVTYTVKCDKHEEYSICPNCDAEYFSGNEKNPKINPAGVCKDRVEKKICEKALENIDSTTRPVNRDSNGNIVIPNCNIFLVSCSESADFRFGQRIDDSGPVSYNCFVGFIYAPYMSYKANGQDLGDYLMHMGGMVVSDYKFLSKNSFIACWPSVYPPKNVFDEESLNSTLNPVSEKRYRIKLKATY